jgi:HPt (histidine-containing phosphotransfer) domain-containing protein
MGDASNNSAGSGTNAVLDITSALERIDGDRELYDEVVVVFLDDTPKQLRILEEAVKSDDRTLVRRQAHSLKSAAANIGGEALSGVAYALETSALEADDEAIDSAVRNIILEFDRLKQELERL